MSKTDMENTESSESIDSLICFTCKICEAVLVDEKELDGHLVEVHQAKPKEDHKVFRCKECGMKLKFKLIMITHVKGHIRRKARMAPPPKSFSCEVCNELFDMKMQLIKHRKVHKVAKPYQCTFCEKCFPSKLHRDQHIRTHTGEKPYSCQVCSRAFTTKKEVNMHKFVHLDDTIPCLKCGKTFKHDRALKRHSNSVHNPSLDLDSSSEENKNEIDEESNTKSNEDLSNTKEFKCTECNKYFRNKNCMKLHMKSHNEKNFVCCDICHKVFFCKDYLRNHMKVHKITNLYPCEECGKTLREKRSLERHIRSNTIDAPYKCAVCEESFQFKCVLKNHQNDYHAKDKELTFIRQLICSGCKRCFINDGSLKIHLSFNFHGKKYICTCCNKDFDYKCALKLHWESEHPFLKQFSCDECEKAFNMEKDLTKHKKIHSGETSCTICYKVLTTRRGLNNHMITVHNAVDPDLPIAVKVEFQDSDEIEDEEKNVGVLTIDEDNATEFKNEDLD